MKITTLILAIALSTGATTALSQNTGTPMPQPQQQTTTVSDSELEKFATIYVDVQEKSQEMQQNAAKIIQEEGMELERFNELAQANKNPNKEADATEKESKQLTKINTKIQKIQTEFQAKVAEMIQEEGLTVKRYQEVFAALQQDKSLQEKFGAMIQG
ncbi:DUF4168 domain-containing protein [Brumimicrobium aurantiacum]|uniref:DUF4168 domain-containing protein n=1 Tax=Brumimicrobium aurantiacum TaxID=1737063 RepID=A0A3E1EVB4_9FLAO|nr:DUF4168 domain-containing protein [Brumimicrobium aurantiacum]RFC53495.1 DUF4168 domain-containing protein [Brumimicrobium aurantiacum]